MLVERVGDARLPTVHGDFRVVSYRAHDGHEHLAIVEGDPASASTGGGSTGESVLARVHSECMTGDVLGSLKCDCGDQLAHALQAIAAEGRGVVVYMRGHEGRGIGLANKIKAYELQDGGLDTVDANTVQGLPVDARQYDVAAAILRDLGVESVRLMSNNPIKATGLVEHGIAVDALVPLAVPARPESESYLRTKVDRLGHLAPT